MKTHNRKNLLVFVLLIALSLFLLSRCTPNQSESLSAEAPTASPTPSASLNEPTQSSDPEQTSPMSTDTPSPSASPTAKPSATKSKTESPTPRKSVKPTSSPSEEATEPEARVENDNDGDGWPDSIIPTVAFTNANCEDLGDKYLYTYEVNFLGGDNYSWNNGGGRGAIKMELRDGKFWFSPSEEELSNPRYRGPIIYKIRSVIDRSWTLFERLSFDKKTSQSAVERGAKGVKSPLSVSRLYTGERESFQPPDILFSLCRK
jgi:hypothetical protein